MAGFDDLINGKPGDVAVEETPIADEGISEGTNEGTTEQVTAEQVTPEVTTEEKPVEEPTDHLEWLKSQFDIDNEEKLKDIIEKSKMSDEYMGKLDQYEKEIGDIENLKSQFDPSKYFASEKDFIAQQLKIKYPDKNPDILQKIVEGTDKLDDETALAYNYLLNDSNFPGGVEAMKNHIRRMYFGEDYDPAELDEFKKKQLRIDANSARQRLNDFTKVEGLPKFKTAEERKAEFEQQIGDLTEKWRPFDVIPAKFEREVAGHKFNFTYGEDKSLDDYADTFIKASALEPTEENVDLVKDVLEEHAVWMNLDKILESYGNQVKSEVLMQADKEVGNEKPPNRAEATDEKKVKTPSGVEAFLGSRLAPGSTLG